MCVILPVKRFCCLPRARCPNESCRGPLSDGRPWQSSHSKGTCQPRATVLVRYSGLLSKGRQWKKSDRVFSACLFYDTRPDPFSLSSQLIPTQSFCKLAHQRMLVCTAATAQNRTKAEASDIDLSAPASDKDPLRFAGAAVCDLTDLACFAGSVVPGVSRVSRSSIQAFARGCS